MDKRIESIQKTRLLDSLTVDEIRDCLNTGQMRVATYNKGTSDPFRERYMR